MHESHKNANEYGKYNNNEVVGSNNEIASQLSAKECKSIIFYLTNFTLINIIQNHVKRSFTELSCIELVNS